jgi:TRAP-type mannitol/chloroaromatic compound transport system permease small subunit
MTTKVTQEQANALGSCVGLIIGYLVIVFTIMVLWNWLAVMLFGLMSISYWEAFWLWVLCGFLFKSNNAPIVNELQKLRKVM